MGRSPDWPGIAQLGTLWRQGMQDPVGVYSQRSPAAEWKMEMRPGR